MCVFKIDIRLVENFDQENRTTVCSDLPFKLLLKFFTVTTRKLGFLSFQPDFAETFVNGKQPMPAGCADTNQSIGCGQARCTNQRLYVLILIAYYCIDLY